MTSKHAGGLSGLVAGALLGGVAIVTIAFLLARELQPGVQAAVIALLSLGIFLLVLYHQRCRHHLQYQTNDCNRLKQALEERTRNFEYALDSGGIGMFCWNLKSDEVSWNNLHYKIFGFTPDEVEPSYELFRSRVHPEDIAQLESNLEQTKRSGHDYTNRFRIILPGGETRFIEGHGRWTHDENAEAESLVGVIIDTTEAYKKHRELAEKQRQLNNLLENVPAVIARMDLALRHTYVSDRIYHITGLQPAHFIGKTNEDLGMPADLCEHWRKESLLVIDTKAARKITFPFGGESGNTLHFEAHIVPELDKNANVESLLFITHEITELVNSKNALQSSESALREASLRKNDFITELAHELRNVISPLSNSIELLQIKAAGNPESEHINKIMRRQVDILIRMTNDLMDSAMITKGKVNLVASSESLRTVLETAIDMASPGLKARGHSLSALLPEQSLKLKCDAVRLIQVFTNLINNAAKYTPEKGKIEIFYEIESDYIALSVKDNGIGISKEKKSRIFEPFEQGGRAEEKSFTGMGVGLAVVKSLVEQHKGRVEVQSDGPDQGSLFKVFLPLDHSTSLG